MTKKTHYFFERIPYIIQTLILVFFFYHLFVKIFDIPWQNYVSAIIALTITILAFLYYRKEFKAAEYIILVYMAVLVFWTSTTQGFPLLRTWNYYAFLIAYVFGIVVAYSGLHTRLFGIFYLLLTSVFLYGFLFGDIDYKNFNSFVHMNRNGMSLLQLVAVSMLYYSYIDDKHNSPPIWPSVLAVLIAYLSRSRAGILLSSILFLGILLLNLKKIVLKTRTMKFSSKLLTLILVLGLITGVSIILFNMYQNSRLGQLGLASTGRNVIYTQFIQELTWKKFLFGFVPESIYDQFVHLHNSYFQLISYVGVAAIPVFLTLFWVFLKNRTEPLYLLILAIFSLYSLVEYRLFINFADLVFFPPLFIAIRRNREIRIIDQKLEAEE